MCVTVLYEKTRERQFELDCRSPLAQRVGFEPTDGVNRQTISSRSRYDHFDTAAYSIFTAGAEDRASEIC